MYKRQPDGVPIEDREGLGYESIFTRSFYYDKAHVSADSKCVVLTNDIGIYYRIPFSVIDNPRNLAKIIIKNKIDSLDKRVEDIRVETEERLEYERLKAKYG